MFCADETSPSDLDNFPVNVSTSPEQQKKLSSQQRFHLVHNLGGNWVDLARDGLNLLPAVVAQVKEKSPGNLVGQARELIDTWQDRRGSRATVDAMTRALRAIQQVGLAEEIEEIGEKGAPIQC